MCAGSGVHSEHAISFCFDMSLARCSGTSMERQNRSRKNEDGTEFLQYSRLSAVNTCRAPRTHDIVCCFLCYEGYRMAIREMTVEEENRFLADAMEREEPRLRSFIRRRVLDTSDAEDVLQDVFYELISAYRMMKPVEQVTAWMFRVARNRVADLFRRRKTVSLQESAGRAEEEGQTLEDLLPSPEAGPDAVFARQVLLEALEEALEDLPESQREVFVAHEVLGRSFKELSEEMGVGVNTLLARKRYAVLQLRERLSELRDEIGTK